MFGLTLEEAGGPPVYLWPDVEQSVRVFIGMGTQWRRGGMAGALTGLDYAALPVVLRIYAIPRALWADVFDDIRQMEVAVLDMANQKK